MILLDTNAVIWILTGHKRAQHLITPGQRLYASPVSMLEMQFLSEVGRLPRETIAMAVNDSRWTLDSPSSSVLFQAALTLEWTRDPFDRLIVAHARCRRWKLATGDTVLKQRLKEQDLEAL
jgi:PIN domain nuclease of toxin-antitoxin system